MNMLPEEERFAKNVKIMADAVYESVMQLYEAGYKTVDPSMILFIGQMIQSFDDKNYLIQGFIENSHEKCWDSIKNRDEQFFVENAGNIFKYLPNDKVNLFKDLFITKDKYGNSVVSIELKNQLWKLFDAMIKISIKYIHKNRGPCLMENGIPAYKISFFPTVDVSYHAKNWQVILEF